jgi:RNA polymerase sigma factor (sigma-70 family)
LDVSTDDERLLIEAAKADPARFLDLYDRHVDRVYAYVSRRAGSRSVAEDVTSAVFEQALSNIGKFEWRGVPFAAWLFRIAANALADHWKREGAMSHELPPDVPDEREHQDLERRMACFSWWTGCRRAAAGDSDAVRRRPQHPRGGGCARIDPRGRSSSCSCARIETLREGLRIAGQCSGRQGTSWLTSCCPIASTRSSTRWSRAATPARRCATRSWRRWPGWLPTCGTTRNRDFTTRLRARFERRTP